MAEYWTWEVFNFSDTDILKASYVFWLEFLMKLYQIGTTCQLETDVAFNTPPPAKVWSDNWIIQVSFKGVDINLLGY